MWLSLDCEKCLNDSRFIDRDRFSLPKVSCVDHLEESNEKVASVANDTVLAMYEKIIIGGGRRGLGERGRQSGGNCCILHDNVIIHLNECRYLFHTKLDVGPCIIYRGWKDEIIILSNRLLHSFLFASVCVCALYFFARVN